ncbi:hypothetical protein HJC23_012340 [Cyclotella cryptica]|uniref:Sulfotransferase n=1 Tax=Cyclotella cryptica TaxID=29204 RepID=A0ABD3QDB3_9STRA|eukprot:CCRYP_006538-RA/>CCRYP_006538-RA protein AED:0.00 eAED:0.00 QI:24/-1/1/1/-1/0/1/97/395
MNVIRPEGSVFNTPAPAKCQSLSFSVRLRNSINKDLKSRLRPKLKSTRVLIFLTIKALIIIILINFYMVWLLSKIGPNSSQPADGKIVQRQILPDKILACVKNDDEFSGPVSHRGIGPNCKLYPCVEENGLFIETNIPDRTIGYAGTFVHRDKNVKKYTMIKPGGRTWASGCIVSDEYKFVYIHVLKSGGTATKEFLRKSLCGENDNDCTKVDPRVIRPFSCRHAVNIDGYFVFSFVRNPFSRMYSMYSMMDGFPVNPDLRGRVTENISFQDFVMTEPKSRKKFTKMHPSHYYNQTDFLFSRNSCPSFDFLGRVEHFDDDMRTILEHLNATKMIAYLDKLGGVIHPANTWGANKKKSIGGDLRMEYRAQELRHRVATVYSKDFDLLGYDAHEVPQ